MPWARRPAANRMSSTPVILKKRGRFKRGVPREEQGHPLKDLLRPTLECSHSPENDAACRQADQHGHPCPQPDAAELAPVAHPGQKGQDDADNKGGLQSLPQGDEKRRGHTTSFDYSAQPGRSPCFRPGIWGAVWPC